MSGKRNVSVCRGHELANALYIGNIEAPKTNDNGVELVANGFWKSQQWKTTCKCDRYYIRTHVYMFLFSVKKRVPGLSRV